MRWAFRLERDVCREWGRRGGRRAGGLLLCCLLLFSLLFLFARRFILRFVLLGLFSFGFACLKIFFQAFHAVLLRNFIKQNVKFVLFEDG